nr:retrovirus-related Pol polyprotein from transposon TNT 1-94 [Tanacetum cinerariifolium]
MCNKTAKDLWDALARHMLGSEYDKQDRKAAVLYEYETFKATEGELLLDTYIRYLQVINDLKKCGYSKDNSTSSANKKQEYVKFDDKKEEKKVDEKKRDMSKVKCYNYEQVLLAEDHAWMESNSDSDQEINANMVFMAQIEKVLLDSEANSSSSDDKIAQIKFSDDYLQEIINPDFEKIDFPFQQTSSLKPYVLIMILKNIIIDLEDEVVSLLEKEKENLKIIEFLKSKGFESSENAISESENQSQNDCQVIEKVVTKWRIQIVRRPKPSGVMWMKKGSSSTVKVDFSSGNHSNLNKNVKRYSRKNLMACNNSDIRSAFDCNNARNALCNARMNDSVDVNDLFVFDDRVRTDNGTEFKNKTLAKFFDEVCITQQFYAARTPQQNGVVERRNRTLVEAVRTMLTFINLPSFLWAKAIATACFTQNRLIIHKRFDKTHYELMNKRKPNIKFFRVFGCICYLLNDYEDVGKLKAKGDIGVFVGYSKVSATFRIYNK